MLHTAANARTLAVPLGRRCLGISGVVMPTSDVVGKPTTVNMQEVPGTPGLCNDLHELSTELIERIEGSRFGIQYTVLISGSGRSWDS